MNELLPRIYDELRAVARRMMSGERAGHTLEATALVHEAYFRLIDQRNLAPADRGRFLAAAATTIRRILVDHAKQRRAAKRGGGWRRVDYDGAAEPSTAAVDLVALDEALQRLGRLHERAAKVVTMRYFGGLTTERIAGALGVCPRTVADDWAIARAWLRRELDATCRGDEV
jgi:RNA polymerase sigma factor (TIGR02999 family)